ncbi:conserved exported hypothetical protein [Carnobacterium maltaromaticum]|uniref:hypothetical protein n=1 Tax=Carnobacterium maltaromaticum TaxID=2751 RepID=UPI00191B991E|nr:hypothetical protein [Carnobacterium maltaromaticum]CAD5902054.1 conserved exported hypothetical protein [Carnobacterium maltaromaticum]
MKKISLLALLFLCGLTFNSMDVFAENVQNTRLENTSNCDPVADIIEWRYKTENGKLYKRKYNRSKDKWIGNWILVG